MCVCVCVCVCRFGTVSVSLHGYQVLMRVPHPFLSIQGGYLEYILKFAASEVGTYWSAAMEQNRTIIIIITASCQNYQSVGE